MPHHGRILAPLLLALIFAAQSSGADDSPSERLPVPNSAAQTKIQNEIRSQYKEDYAKRDPADQLSLAGNFRAQAAAASNDPVRQYVFLREARELATNAGNFDIGFAIIDDIAKLFTIDAEEWKVDVLVNASDRSTLPKPDLVENYLKVCAAALDIGNVQLAHQSCLLATRTAQATRNPPLVQRVRQYELRVHDASRALTAVVSAAGKLKAHPDDPDANLQVGRYLCFVQHQWDQGLPLLVHGSDKQLRELAEKDQEGPNDSTAMAALADSWWELPDTKQTPQKAARERAVHWYQMALQGLSGEAKTRVEKQISQAPSSQPSER